MASGGKKPTRRYHFSNPTAAAVAGAKGGRAGAVKRRIHAPAPYAGNIDDVMDLLGLTGPDWAAWRAILKACFCLSLTVDELATFQRLTGLDVPPSSWVLELWLCCGRRAGKSTIAALLAFFKGIRANPSLFAKKDELIVLPVIAADRKQARVLLGHLRSFARHAALLQYVKRTDLRDSIELANGITIEIQTSSSRSTRGYTAVCIVVDEVGVMPTEGADPAQEILAAITPTMGTVPDPLLVALSNPHEPRGPLFDAVNRYYGQPNNDGVLVVVADTTALHPSFSRAVIQRAMTRDAVKCISEYGDPDTGKILFRQGESALFDQSAVDSAVGGHLELPPVDGVTYFAFGDAAQGARSGDSMCLCLGHVANGIIVIDKLVERRPPFSPMDVLVNDFAPVLRRYRIRRVFADNVSRGFVEATLNHLGFTFEVSALDKSALYLNLLNVINSGGVSLPDDATLRLQLLSLQRYPAMGGRDRVDHPRGRAYHDDVANCVAGVVALGSRVMGADTGLTVAWRAGADTHSTVAPQTRAQFDANQLGRLAVLARRTAAQFAAMDRAAERDFERDANDPGRIVFR